MPRDGSLTLSDVRGPTMTIESKHAVDTGAMRGSGPLGQDPGD
jgi:hypothetical protein